MLCKDECLNEHLNEYTKSSESASRKYQQKTKKAPSEEEASYQFIRFIRYQSRK